MPNSKEVEAELRAAIASLAPEKKDRFILGVVSALYFNGRKWDMGKEWDSDTPEEIACVVTQSGLDALIPDHEWYED